MCDTNRIHQMKPPWALLAFHQVMWLSANSRPFVKNVIYVQRQGHNVDRVGK